VRRVLLLSGLVLAALPVGSALASINQTCSSGTCTTTIDTTTTSTTFPR
jgi:hypothetical protein